MIEVTPTKQQILIARRKSKKMGVLNNSITSGKGNIYGFLGELLVNNYIKGKIKNTYDYDIVKNNIKIDVKENRERFYFIFILSFLFSRLVEDFIYLIIYCFFA